MIAMLPVEKLPLFVLGTVLVLIGAYLMFVEPAFSWQQGRALLFFLLGAWAIVFDVGKRRSAKEENGGNRPEAVVREGAGDSFSKHHGV